MPGPYAHLTVISELARLGFFPGRLHVSPGLSGSTRSLTGYCMLGTVGPDFPNLGAPESGSAIWADAMHYGSSGRMIIHGIELLQRMPDHHGKTHCLAWLLGYCAHVVADAVIHPVVQLKVGEYETNVLAHRQCELHQDLHIAPLLGLGKIGSSSNLNRLLRDCCHHEKSTMLSQDIARFWSALLTRCHPVLSLQKPPDIHGWFRNALQLADIGATEANHLFPLARNIMVKTGLHYPASGNSDPGYVDKLHVPGGAIMSYRDVFAKAVFHTADAWHIIVEAVYEESRAYASWFADWNLDTGIDDSGRLAFW